MIDHIDNPNFDFCWAHHVTIMWPSRDAIQRGFPMLFHILLRIWDPKIFLDSKPLYSVNMFHCQLSVNSKILSIHFQSSTDF